MPDETAIAPPAAISDEEATQKPWEMFAAKKPWQLFAPAPAPSAAVPPPPAPRFDTAKVKLDPYQESFLKTGTTEPSQQSFENWLSWHPPGKQGIGPATGISELTGWDRLKFSIQNKLESVFPGMAEKGSPSPASVVGGAAMVAPLGLPENLGKLLLGYFAYRTAKAQPDIYRQIKSEIQSGNYSEAQRTAVEDILQMGMIGTGAAGLREPAPTPTPYAREIQTSATVHGDLRPQPISREGPVPVPKSGGGIQPQAEGRLPQAPPGQVPLTPEARPGQMPPVEAGPPTGARGGPIPGAPPSQVSLTLALLVDGKPMTGGKDHIEIRDNLAKGSDAQADAALAAFAEDKNHVFLDENKNVLTREQAGARLGLKELHSGDLETLPKPLTASEVLARPPDGVSALEIAVMPGKELLDLIQRRGPKNELLYPPQRGAVLWGMKQPASELPKLEMMRDEANRQNQATFAKTSQLDMVAQTKSFWYSAAIEGIREEGGNYAAVKAETPPPTIQPAVKPVALEPKGDVKEISQLPEKAKIAESEPVLAQGPGAMTAKPSVRPGPPEVFEGTALKNAVGELERLGFDLAEATSTMRSEMAQSWLRSGKTLAQNPEAGRQLADQLKWNPEMGLTDDQSALLLRHKVTLENSLNDAAERTHTAKDPTARATAQKEYERLGNEFTELLDAIKHRGGEWGREGRWRQAIARENYSFTSQEQIARAYKAATGKDFTPQEADTAKKIAGKGKAVTADVESAKQKLYTRLGREAGGTDAEKQAIAAAHKTVREAAARMSEAENKVRVADQALANERANVQEQAKNKALAATGKTVRDAAVRQAKAESKRRVAQAVRDKRTAQVQAKAAKKALDAANQVVRNAAAHAAQAEVDARVNPEKRVWAGVKKYLDEGEKDFDDIRNKVATDLGMPVGKVTDLLTRSKRLKYLADDVWKKQQDLRRFQEQAKRWLKQTALPKYQRALQSIPRILFSLKVGFHGTVALGTHAPTVAFQPRFWNAYVRDFGKMYHMIGSPTYYEMQVQDLLRRPNYITARRAGLVNDPFQFEDYNSPTVAQYIGRLSGMGNRGYSVLKILRQDMFDQHWNNLPKTSQIPEFAERLANGINHATGVVKGKAPPGTHLGLFAPRLEASRVMWLAGDPFKMADTFLNWKNASPADKYFALNQMKEKAWVLGTMAGLLAINQGVLSALGSKQKINLTDPFKSDFLKFKAAGMDLAYGNAMVAMARFPLRLWVGIKNEGKLNKIIYEDENTAKTIFDYARSQASPFAGLTLDLAFGRDFQQRPLPRAGFGLLPPRTTMPKRLREQGAVPYTWTEFWSEQALPIPAEEALKEVWHTGLGMSDEQVNHLLKATATITVMGATGARLTDDVPSKPPSAPAAPPPWAVNAP